MARLNFTAASLREHFDKNPRSAVYDVQQRGLAAYMTSTSQITFFAHFRVGSRQVKKTLARLSELPVAEARRKVATLVIAGKEGTDIVGDRRREAERAVTLGEIFLQHRESMIRRKCSPASVAVNEGVWRARLSKYGSRPLSSFTKTEVRAMHQQWRRAGPCAANRAIRLLSTLHNFAAKKTDAELGSNPCQAVDLWPERLKREVLAFDKLGEWWQAVNALPNKSHSAYFKLLLYSGLRRTDGLEIKLSEIRGDHIFRPNPKGGPRKSFSVPLTPQLRAIVDEALAARELLHPHSDYLFPANSKSGHVSCMWHNQVQVQGVAVTPHCLRRTYISAGASIGVNFIHLKALANHVGNAGDVTLTSYVKVPFEDRMTSARKIAEFLDTKIRSLSLGETKLLTHQPSEALEPAGA